MAAGDNSFESLALPHLDALYRVARRLARSDHEAEDLVQETVLKAYKSFQTFEMREFGIKPWLFRILNNTYLNWLARDKRAPRPGDQAVLEALPGDASEIAPDIDYDQVDEEVKRAIDQLPVEFRSVVVLWATSEFSYQEIASILSVPIGTVMSRLHRGRAQLASALRDYARRNRFPGELEE